MEDFVLAVEPTDFVERHNHYDNNISASTLQVTSAIEKFQIQVWEWKPDYLRKL